MRGLTRARQLLLPFPNFHIEIFVAMVTEQHRSLGTLRKLHSRLNRPSDSLACEAHNSAVAVNFDPAPATVQLHRCEYVSPCRASRCRLRATVIARKLDAAGRFIRQIELCDRHAKIIAARERKHGLQIDDRRRGGGVEATMCAKSPSKPTVEAVSTRTRASDSRLTSRVIAMLRQKDSTHRGRP